MGDTYIVFAQIVDRFLDVPYHRCRVGLNHLAFHADSRQQVDNISEKLKGKGITVLYTEQHPFAGADNHYAVYSNDTLK